MCVNTQCTPADVPTCVHIYIYIYHINHAYYSIHSQTHSTHTQRVRIYWIRTCADTHVRIRCARKMVRVFMSTKKKDTRVLKPIGGESQDAPSRRSISAKEPLIIGLFCEKITYKDKERYLSCKGHRHCRRRQTCWNSERLGWDCYPMIHQWARAQARWVPQCSLKYNK